jgi:hypothetical protein
MVAKRKGMEIFTIMNMVFYVREVATCLQY